MSQDHSDVAAHWSDAINPAEITTPAYVYSIAEISRRIRALKEALGTEVLISFKACGNYDIISRLPADCFDGIELASRGELHTLAGHRPKHFYVNTPALTDSLVRAGIGAKVSFVVDQPDHLDLIARARGKRELQPVHLRLSNRLIQQMSPDAPNLRLDQFGMDMDAVFLAIERARSLGIEIDGTHLYGGPHTFGRAAHHVVTAMLKILPQIEERLGHPLHTLDLGGGLEEAWESKEYDFAAYRAAMAQLPARLNLVHEFGRAIFTSGGVFAVRVLWTKSISGQQYAVCDGGMAQAFLLAQTENIMRKYRSPRVLGRAAQASADGSKTLIVGSTCSRDDVIGETSLQLQAGDILVFEQCGAYFRTYSMNNFLTLGEPSVYVI